MQVASQSGLMRTKFSSILVVDSVMQFSNQMSLRILSELGSADNALFVIQSEDPPCTWQESAVSLYADKAQLQQFAVSDQCRISFAAGQQCGARRQSFTYHITGYSFPEDGNETVVTVKHMPQGDCYRYPLMQLVNDPHIMAQMSVNDAMMLAYYAAERRLQQEKALLAAQGQED